MITCAIVLATVGVLTVAPSSEGAREPKAVALATFQALQTEQSTVRTLEVAIRSIFGMRLVTVAVLDPKGWTILRNQPFGLAIGNGRRGWDFDPATRSPLGYTSGWVHGGWQGCAWTSTRNLGGNLIPVRGDCANFNPPLKSFISRINCILCHGGTAVRLTRPAVEYANYKPARGLTSPVHTADAGQCVEWRYISKDQKVAMVKDRRFPNDEASWVFVSRESLPPDANLPKNHQSRCWRSSLGLKSGN